MSRPAGEPACEEWDAVVIGAGPAGGLAAHALAGAGHSVLLVERSHWPRWKVCGCYLNLNALDALERAGLGGPGAVGGLAQRCGARPLHTFQVSTRGRSARVPLPGGVALSRARLDAALVEEADARGARFEPGTPATVGRIEGDWRRVHLGGGSHERTVRARVVVAAWGLGARSWEDDTQTEVLPGRGGRPGRRGRIGAGVILESSASQLAAGDVHMACGRSGYVGCVRLEDGRLDYGAALEPEFVRAAGGLGAAATAILEEAGVTAPEHLARAAWRGTPALSRTTTRVAAERVLLAGDATGYVEPFTGEGIAWALGSGLALAPIASRGIAAWRPELELEWTRAHEQVVRKRQAACRALAWMLRRPRLVEIAVHALARWPGLAGPLIKNLNAGARVSQPGGG